MRTELEIPNQITKNNFDRVPKLLSVLKEIILNLLGVWTQQAMPIWLEWEIKLQTSQELR